MFSKEHAWDGIESAVIASCLEQRGLDGTIAYVTTLHRAIEVAKERGFIGEVAECADEMDSIIRESSG